jgi:3-hydroxyacyl-CoA dehydrogenase / enoyl-CoA hydratase / 3-hydroxybutyryl-CoA epimerase
LDVCLAALSGLKPRAGTQMVIGCLKQYVQDGHLGLKTGRGFYEYEKGKITQSTAPSSGGGVPADLIDRLMGRILNEAMACVREGIVASEDLVDAGCIFGFGFPLFLGGPFHWVHSMGRDVAVRKLQALEERYGEDFACDPGWTMASEAAKAY